MDEGEEDDTHVHCTGNDNDSVITSFLIKGMTRPRQNNCLRFILQFQGRY